jgi:hypothetical protein
VFYLELEDFLFYLFPDLGSDFCAADKFGSHFPLQSIIILKAIIIIEFYQGAMPVIFWVNLVLF